MAGLKIAAEYYFDDLVFHMFATGDTSHFAPVCPEFYELCSGFLRDANEMREARRFFVSGPITITQAEAKGPLNDRGDFYYGANGRIEAGRTFSTDGQILEQTEPYEFTIEANFRHREGLWVLAGANVQPQVTDK